MENILEIKKYGTNEYGMSLFHDINYNPVFIYKPFTPNKCTKTFIEHYQRISYGGMECSQCQLRRRGVSTDDICHCE